MATNTKESLRQKRGSSILPPLFITSSFSSFPPFLFSSLPPFHPSYLNGEQCRNSVNVRQSSQRMKSMNETLCGNFPASDTSRSNGSLVRFSALWRKSSFLSVFTFLLYQNNLFGKDSRGINKLQRITYNLKIHWSPWQGTTFL